MTPTEKTFILHYLNLLETNVKGLRAMIIQSSQNQEFTPIPVAAKASKLNDAGVEYLSAEEEAEFDLDVSKIFGQPVKEVE